MKILQLAPLWETVPPPAYGGTEAVVSALTEELVGRGHKVTLWASGDSSTSARLRSVCQFSLRSAGVADRYPHDWLHIASALAEADQFDIVHNHAGELAMAFSATTPAPMLSTMHCQITPDTQAIWDRYDGYYNTISRAQRETMPSVQGGRFVGPVYNGIDVASFPFCSEKDAYLLFLSRMSEEKAPHLAIEVARRAGMRLVMAGKVDWRDEPYFNRMVREQIDGTQIVFAGEADARLKRELYRKALCLLLPLCWEEPFGLVMPEAMACGTPVIAFPRGAAPELIVDGKTGYLVEDVDQMVAAVGRIAAINPADCRRHVEQRFGIGQMAAAYEAAYASILDSEEAMHRVERNSGVSAASELVRASGLSGRLTSVSAD